jgi:hypothetical protein
MARTHVILAGALAILLEGCAQEFAPNGPFAPRLVVYSILSSRTDTQYVRVYVASDPTAAAGGEVDVPDAQVSVSDGAKTYTFHDTLVARSDTGRLSAPIKAHVAYQFAMERQKTYHFTVRSATYGSVSATASTLLEGSLLVINPPDPRNDQEDITVFVEPGANVRAYILRLMLEYDALINNVWVRQSIEVPADLLDQVPVYPSLVARGSGIPSPLAGFDQARFTQRAFGKILRSLEASYPGGTHVLRRAVFAYTQVDDAIYAYYNVVNGFPGTSTLRLDEPDYSNVTGGLGLVGAMSETFTPVTIR